ncbi:alpha/beta hydrolase [Paludibacterium yongneupense]|uniref:alpha/beta hydrolase n=1 Tax=Paludibacterium yongneupense TaxID=400061 RepID=UPI0004168783|nr:alpha/beta hydrolase [Paludibacterium yongneupense]
MQTRLLTAGDGEAITLHGWMPDAAARGVVLLSHGMSEHGARYDTFARTLVLAGWIVYAHDHRGHGAGARIRGWFAERDGWERVVDDLHAVREWAVAQHPGLPVFLFGHSMGSFIARSYVVRHGDGLAGLILSATGYRQGVVARAMRKIARLTARFGNKEDPSRVMGCLVFGSFNLTFIPSRSPVDWLTRDTAEVDRYLADRLCGFPPTSAMWIDLFDGVIEMERAEKNGSRLPKHCPLLLLAGSRDPVSLGRFGLEQLARRYRRAGAGDVTVKVYRGGRHEMHNELNRDEVMADLATWLDQRANQNAQAA